MTTYDVGERVVLSTILRDNQGEPTNGDVTLTVTAPSFSATPVLSNPSIGNYTGSLIVTEPGDYSYIWSSSDPDVIDDGSFSVVPVGSSSKLYASIEELRAHVGDSKHSSIPSDELRKALMVASRSIDLFTGRRFWRDPQPTTRRYRPLDCGYLDVMDIASTEDLVVSVDPNATGTYSQAWTLDTHFILCPDNPDADGFGAYSWNRLEAIGNYSFPTSNRRPTVRITAYHGWSAIPDQIREATIIKATSLYKRGDAPFGIAGSQEFGMVRLSKFEDPDVIRLVDPFRPPLIGVM